ncbi:hypothetical protein QFC21_002450 [Naganishia friedmannii]|uniref:Uncharacterized protein n=1 Tax=Naganishia friedmannii TaxID=89922 RepID=A0ACC2VXD2_9TREE|nr:hypothetical protein QFC21_002450 [Naganishia friedmannii]
MVLSTRIAVDDGTTPHLAAIGPSQIALYTGSATQQTFLQELAANIDVSTSNSVDAWIDASLGPNGNYYFIRVLSLGLKDTAQPEYPYQSYSARFILNNMSGSFNSSVWQQLGTTSSSSGGSSSSSSSGSRGGGSSGSTSGSSGSSSKGSSSSSSGKTSSSTSESGDGGESSTDAPGGTTGQTNGGKTGSTTGGTTTGSGAGVAGAGAGSGSTNAGLNTVAGNSAAGKTSPTSSSIGIASASPTTSTTAPTTSSSSAAATRLSAPFAFKAPNTMARSSQPGSPEGRTATLMITSVLVGVFGFGLAIAL